MKIKKILESSFNLQPKDANQKLEIYKCKYCGQTYARHITRMSVHLLKCNGCPAAVKELLKEKVKDKILESSKYGMNKKGQVKNLKKILEENFNLQPKSGTQKLDIYQCKHCEQKYARNASRMSLHLQKCLSCPEEVKSAIEINIKGNLVHKVQRNLIPKQLLETSFILQPKEPNQKLQTFKCKYCGQVYARHSTRMSIHLQKCIGCPGSVKDSLKEKVKVKMEQRKSDQNPNRQSDESEEIVMIEEEMDPVMMQMSSSNLYSFNESANEGHFIDKMTKQRQKYCEELLAKAIYASNAPIGIIDNDHWRTLLNTLSPAFQLPTQHQLATSLLDTTYENVKKCVDQKVRNAVSIGLQCSYRSNSRNEGIIHFVLTTPDPVLYKSISLSSNVEDENLYLEKISEVIDEVGAERVLGVCLDTLSTCENMCELLQEKYEEYNIAFYNCSSQTLNRLLNEICDLPSVSALLKNTSTMAKDIKQSQILSAILNESQKSANEKNDNISLQLSGTKKWNSSLIYLDSLAENKNNLQVLAFSPKADKYLNQQTKDLISDEDFWNKITSYIKLIKPIIKWISHLDQTESKISEVPELFADLEQHFVNEFQESSSLTLLTDEESNQILKRFKSLSGSVLQPIQYAANILSPLLKGEHLNQSEFVQGTEIITKLAAKFGMPEDDILVDFANYNSNKGIWGVNFVRKSIPLMPPSTWWNGFFKNSFLTKIAAAILDLPSTSVATTDRSNKRNSLNDPTGKVMYINQNLRLLDPKRNDKNKLSQEELQDKIEDGIMIDDIEVYNDDIEEVLVEDHEETMEEAEEITGDLDESDVQSNGVYIQVISENGETFYVQQSIA